MTLIVRYGGTAYTEIDRDEPALREAIWRKIDRDEHGWVKLVTPTGEVTIFVARGIPIALEQLNE